MKMEQTECSETSAYKIQTTGNYPEESIHYPSVKFPENPSFGSRVVPYGRTDGRNMTKIVVAFVIFAKNALPNIHSLGRDLSPWPSSSPTVVFFVLDAPWNLNLDTSSMNIY